MNKSNYLNIKITACIAIPALFLASCQYKSEESYSIEQKELIQKTVNILDEIGYDLPNGMNDSIRRKQGISNSYVEDSILKACKSLSIETRKLDELLGSGVKVISTIDWNQSINARGLPGTGLAYKGKCMGRSYILEGEKDVLWLI